MGIDYDPFAAYQNVELRKESSGEAEKLADTLSGQGLSFRSALLNMNHGLLLLEGLPGDFQSKGVRFLGANCGFDGQGVQAAAYILTVFDFGTEAALFDKLKRLNIVELVR